MRCTISIDQQIRELAKLEDGWLNGEGAQVSMLTLMEARRRAVELMERTGVVPFLYPTVLGGVSVEWDEDGGGQFEVERIPPLLTVAEEVKGRS